MCIPQQAHDVVLMVKAFMHSAEPCQNRILVMPHSVAMDIFASKERLKLHPPIVFTDEQLKDYRATASAVARQPWELFKAQTYLENLCQA